MSPVAAITGFGSVAMQGLMCEGNVGAVALSITGSATSSSTGAPPAGPGTHNVVISDAKVSDNQGSSAGGVIVYFSGSVLIRGSTFRNNWAASAQVIHADRSCEVLGYLCHRLPVGYLNAAVTASRVCGSSQKESICCEAGIF